MLYNLVHVIDRSGVISFMSHCREEKIVLKQKYLNMSQVSKHQNAVCILCLYTHTHTVNIIRACKKTSAELFQSCSSAVCTYVSFSPPIHTISFRVVFEVSKLIFQMAQLAIAIYVNMIFPNAIFIYYYYYSCCTCLCWQVLRWAPVEKANHSGFMIEELTTRTFKWHFSFPFFYSAWEVSEFFLLHFVHPFTLS
jgi:hypothetical protein